MVFINRKGLLYMSSYLEMARQHLCIANKISEIPHHESQILTKTIAEHLNLALRCYLMDEAVKSGSKINEDTGNLYQLTDMKLSKVVGGELGVNFDRINSWYLASYSSCGPDIEPGIVEHVRYAMNAVIKGEVEKQLETWVGGLSKVARRRLVELIEFAVTGD